METLTAHNDADELRPARRQTRFISWILLVLAIVLLFISVITGVVVFQHYNVAPLPFTMSCPS